MLKAIPLPGLVGFLCREVLLPTHIDMSITRSYNTTLISSNQCTCASISETLTMTGAGKRLYTILIGLEMSIDISKRKF